MTCAWHNVNGLFNFCRGTLVATVQPAYPTVQLNASSIDNTSEPFDGDEYLLIGGMGRPLRITSRCRCVPAAAPSTSHSTCECAKLSCSEWHVSHDRYPDTSTMKAFSISNCTVNCRRAICITFNFDFLENNLKLYVMIISLYLHIIFYVFWLQNYFSFFLNLRNTLYKSVYIFL